jgi:hypothetical protein
VPCGLINPPEGLINQKIGQKARGDQGSKFENISANINNCQENCGMNF